MIDRRICTAVATLTLLSTTLRAGDAPGLFDTSWLGFDTGLYGETGAAWYPTAMAVADFDGDGDPDAATANINNFLPVAPRVSVILNDGDGTYGPATAYVTPTETEDIIAGDFDGDGDQDLLIADTGGFGNGTTVSLLPGHGDGTFGAEVSYPSAAPGPVGLAAADFDQDGRLDVAVANYGWQGAGSTVSILLNDGAGGFEAPIVHTVGPRPYRLDAGDLDGDGWPDLALASGNGLQQTTSVKVLLNDGAGGFGAPDTLSSLVSGGAFYPSIKIVDVDLDGDADVVYSDLKLHIGSFNTLYGVAIYRNSGDGTFAAAETVPLGATTGAACELAVADVTGDGWPDILAPHRANEGWSVIASDGAGGYLPYTEYIASESPTDVVAADADGDGDLDALVLGYFSLEITVHYNAGHGDFAPLLHSPVTLPAYHMDAADVDGDGDLDMAASYGYASNGILAVMLNDGDGTFGTVTQIPAPVYASSVKLRDLDGDNAPDLLWADKYPPYSFRTKLNNGDGTFAATQSWLGTFTCGVTLNSDAIQAFDLDADGDLDVVLSENLSCGTGPKRLFVHENDGTGGLTLVEIIDMNWPPYEIMAADVNEDGHLDLVTSGFTVDVALGHGDLTFSAPYSQGAINVPARPAALADLDGDGHVDVAFGFPGYTNAYESLGVMLGRGDGTFETPVLYRETHSPNLDQITSITTGDADGDGDQDVMIGNYASNDLSYFENNGDGTFQTPYHVGAGNDTRDVLFGDFTGDGIGDFAAMVDTPQEEAVVAIVAGRASVPPGIPGDVDGDGQVGVVDLVAVITAWGPCAPPPAECPADLNADGAVDVADLVLVVLGWT